jgi:hypothetical protein
VLARRLVHFTATFTGGAYEERLLTLVGDRTCGTRPIFHFEQSSLQFHGSIYDILAFPSWTIPALLLDRTGLDLTVESSLTRKFNLEYNY